jgi:uncharacterized protein YecT (DUF1311 family)
MPKMVAAAVALAFSAAPFLPAWALDCKKAASPTDKAICADPATNAVDDSMAKAYSALAASLSEADKKSLLLSQREWLKLRAISCLDKKGAELSQCFKTMTEARQKFLAGTPADGPGSGGKLRPVFVQKPERKGAYTVDVAVLKYSPPTMPAEKLFNDEVDKLLKDIPNGSDEDLDKDRTYAYQLGLAVTYASPQLISAHADIFVDGGGAHPNSSSSNINIDVTKAKLLTFEDLFAPSAEPKILGECMKQILAQKAERLSEEKIEGQELAELRKSVSEGLHALDRWSFKTGTSEVGYDAYALGAYVEGTYSCTFSTDFLRPLVKAGLQLP